MVAGLSHTCAAASSGHLSAKRVPFFAIIGHFALAALLLVSVGCAQTSPAASGDPIAVDDFADTLRLSAPPSRIVSLTPATTELLFALGAGNRVVGRTRWDVWPEEAAAVPDMGDGLRPNVEAVLAAAPELVILYGSGENGPAARRLREAGVQTLSLKVDSPEDFTRLTRILGAVLGDTMTSARVLGEVTGGLQGVRERTAALPRKRVVWIADSDPLIVIGAGSFLNTLMSVAGGENVFADIDAPSATVALEAIVARDPGVIIASPSIIRRIRDGGAWGALLKGRTRELVEADSYTMGRPSVRMADAAHQLALLLHPGAFR